MNPKTVAFMGSDWTDHDGMPEEARTRLSSEYGRVVFSRSHSHADVVEAAKAAGATVYIHCREWPHYADGLKCGFLTESSSCFTAQDDEAAHP